MARPTNRFGVFTSIDPQTLRWLLRDKYHWTPTQIHDFSQTSAELSPEIQKDLERLETGEPIQYVIGWVNFLGCHIDLSYQPLIPRPETEFWVEQVIKNVKAEGGEQPKKILDLCCGSGCIGVALLKHLPESHVDFVDISNTALQQTQHNLQLNDIDNSRYTIIQSNLFEQLHDNTYNLILTNPPYVDPQAKLDSGLHFEPPEALFAQNHGLALIEQIISSYQNHLKSNGKLYMEFGMGQEKEIAEFCKKNHYKNPEFHKDQYGIVRWVTLLIS